MALYNLLITSSICLDQKYILNYKLIYLNYPGYRVKVLLDTNGKKLLKASDVFD